MFYDNLRKHSPRLVFLSKKLLVRAVVGFLPPIEDLLALCKVGVLKKKELFSKKKCIYCSQNEGRAKNRASMQGQRLNFFKLHSSKGDDTAHAGSGSRNINPKGRWAIALPGEQTLDV